MGGDIADPRGDTKGSSNEGQESAVDGGHQLPFTPIDHTMATNHPSSSSLPWPKGQAGPCPCAPDENTQATHRRKLLKDMASFGLNFFCSLCNFEEVFVPISIMTGLSPLGAASVSQVSESLLTSVGCPSQHP